MGWVVVGFGGNGYGQGVLDFTRGDAMPEGATHDWNLGPTGLRGWMYSDKLETSAARQVLVTQVDAGSPAEGMIEVGDVILGVGGGLFSYDPRVELGKAIGGAEAAEGRLVLARWRAGEVEEVVLPLAVLGSYSATAPFDCAKSRAIFERGCEVLAARMGEQPGRGNWIERSLGALALLSSGEAEYLPLVREQVKRAAGYSDPGRRDLHSWWYGYLAMLVAEYVLTTGDSEFLPELERLAMEIVEGQSQVGSWGHRFVEAESGRLGGYGMMHSTGLPLMIALALAREAGVGGARLDGAIDKGARLVRFYVGKGSVPYGDHHPWIQTHGDNGKNEMAAVLFQLLGDAAATEYFSRMSVASHGAERDTGHTGNYFNILWAMPAVALSGPAASGAWMEEFSWYFDLARRWDGSFGHQGPPAARPDSYRNWDATGAYLLAYGAGQGTTFLTGRKARIAPALDDEGAGRLIDDGRGWSPGQKHAAYAERDIEELFAGLGSWSPVVRERCAMELARREGDPTARLVGLLGEGSPEQRLGTCQALAQLGRRAGSAVGALQGALRADELWQRIKAAEALASIGGEAMVAVPELLEMLLWTDEVEDPRGMQQRYLSFALFDRRGGLLGQSLDGVDRELLYEAVRAGLGNEDGRARASFGSVYQNLSYDEIENLLPAIYGAVVEPAPSGIMFADGIRLSGLELLAKHGIAEGLPLCLELIEPGRWGLKGRAKRCLDSLRLYGGAARSEIPRLRALEEELGQRMKADEIAALGIDDLIREIEQGEERQLRALGLGG
jgi:hypothetical protein